MPVKLIVLVKRNEGISPDAFREGYENGHARLAVRLFGHLWTAYRRNYLDSGNSFAGFGTGDVADGVLHDTGYDAVSEIIFPDQAAVEEMKRIAIAHYDEIREDEECWFDRPRCWLVGCETIEEDLSSHARVPSA